MHSRVSSVGMDLAGINDAAACCWEHRAQLSLSTTAMSTSTHVFFMYIYLKGVTRVTISLGCFSDDSPELSVVIGLDHNSAEFAVPGRPTRNKIVFDLSVGFGFFI